MTQLMTLDAVKARLEITDAALDAWLVPEIEAISQAIELYCGRRFSHKPDALAEFTPTSPTVFLPRCPVKAITAATAYTRDGSEVILPLNRLHVIPSTGELRGIGLLPIGFAEYATLRVEYAGGPETVPALIQRVLCDLVASRMATKGEDPTRRVKSEVTFEVSSVSYESTVATSRDAALGALLAGFEPTLDLFRDATAASGLADEDLVYAT